MPIFGHERCEDAFTQTSVSHPQTLARPSAEQGLKYRTASQDQIRPLLADTRLSDAFVVAHADEISGNRAHIGGFEPIAVHPRPVVSGQAQVDATAFVMKRTEEYERMWDGCGCRIEYYR